VSSSSKLRRAQPPPAQNGRHIMTHMEVNEKLDMRQRLAHRLTRGQEPDIVRVMISRFTITMVPMMGMPMHAPRAVD
jgi:hypothetical protein